MHDLLQELFGLKGKLAGLFFHKGCDALFIALQNILDQPAFAFSLLQALLENGDFFFKFLLGQFEGLQGDAGLHQDGVDKLQRPSGDGIRQGVELFPGKIIHQKGFQPRHAAVGPPIGSGGCSGFKPLAGRYAKDRMVVVPAEFLGQYALVKSKCLFKFPFV